MKKFSKYLSCSVLLLSILFCLSSCSKKQENTEELNLVNWTREWNDEIFAEAKRSGKPVILSLEANWCHWCHVMKEKNYNNLETARLLNEKFITVAIDQDTNPFLSNLYKDYGWPATILFSPDGKEISKQTGFIEPAEFKTLLETIAKDPFKVLDKEESKVIYSKETSLTPEMRKKLISNWKNSVDYNLGGLKISQKFLDRDTLEYALSVISNNSTLIKKIKERNENPPELLELTNDLNTAKKIARINFDMALRLQDPIWGGFFQYSTGGNWNHLHYEKLTEIQAEYIRSYAYAYMIMGDTKYLLAAKQAAKYMFDFMKDFDNSFYSSQDADLKAGEKANEYYKLSDVERRLQGIPRIDKNRFPNKNGLMIEALATLYKATGDTKYFNAAINAAKTIISKLQKNESKNTIYFIHSANDKNIYLSDNLYMARAFLALYEITGNKEWLYKSISVAEFIKNKFRNIDAGYVSSALDPKQNSSTSNLIKPKPILNENIKLARLFNALYHYSSNPIFMQEAQHIMKYLATEDIAFATLTEPGILVVDTEINTEPIHFCLVGPKNNGKAKQLYTTLLKCPHIYSRLEWYDSKEGKLVNHDVEYPQLPDPAVFGCANKTCSIPVYEVVELQEKLKLD